MLEEVSILKEKMTLLESEKSNILKDKGTKENLLEKSEELVSNMIKTSFCFIALLRKCEKERVIYFFF